jgi:hypothetical protein
MSPVIRAMAPAADFVGESVASLASLVEQGIVAAQEDEELPSLSKIFREQTGG